MYTPIKALNEVHRLTKSALDEIFSFSWPAQWVNSCSLLILS